MITNILFGIIIIHINVGFGFMFWKLSGTVHEDHDSGNTDHL